MLMPNVHDITKAVGRDEIASRLGVGVAAVGNAVARGKFPAAWYFTVAAVCAEKGVECPPDAFNFKSPSADRPSAEAS